MTTKILFTAGNLSTSAESLDAEAMALLNAAEDAEGLFEPLSAEEVFKTTAILQDEWHTIRIGIAAVSEMTHTSLQPSHFVKSLIAMSRSDDNGGEVIYGAEVWIEGGDLVIHLTPGGEAIAEFGGLDDFATDGKWRWAEDHCRWALEDALERTDWGTPNALIELIAERDAGGLGY